MKINELQPHPSHKSIYTTPGDIKSAWRDSYESMERDGQMQPLLVTGDGTIISGVRRWMVAKELGWEEIEVKVFEGDNREIELLLVSSNSNREKTYAEKINEVVHLLEVIGDRQGKRNLPEHLKGCKYELVSKKYGAGFSKDNVFKIAQIVEYDKLNPSEKKLDQLKQGVSVDSVFRSLNSKDNKNDIKKIMEKLGKYTLINKDCNRALIKDIKDGSIALCFTSPPYWSLRLYDGEKKEGNLGEENSVEEYVKNLAKTFKKVYKKLKDDGSLFVNIGDTFQNGLNHAVPELLLVELRKIGFLLVNRFIWRKTNSKPMTSTSGIQPDYEILYHFSKQEKYKVRKIVFKSEEAEKVISGCGDRSKDGKKIKKSKSIQSPYRRFKTFYDENEKFSSIITSAAASSQVLHKIDDNLDHPSIFLDSLPLLAILQTTDVGDKCLDIFSGSATLGYTANLFGREYIGIEKNEAFHYVGVKRMEDAQNKIDEKVYRLWKSEETLTEESSVGKLVEFNNQEERLKMAS
jgi:DNA modification methylase